MVIGIYYEHWLCQCNVMCSMQIYITIQWYHNGRDGISNHQTHDCLLNRLLRHKHQSSASLAFVKGIHWWPVNSLHKWPVTRKMFPFDAAIMRWSINTCQWTNHWMGLNSKCHLWHRALSTQVIDFPQDLITGTYRQNNTGLDCTNETVCRTNGFMITCWHSK